jgi:DNA-binding transcriptional LysR family regulator
MDIIKNVNLNLLKSFWAVFKTGGIIKGAKLLDVAPPTLSANIKQLEKQLGKTLFVTHKKGADPTGDATALFPFVESAFENLLKFSEELERPSTGTIRVGTTTIYASFYLVEFVREFKSKYPNIAIEYHHHPKHDYLTLLEGNEIDVAITPLWWGEASNQMNVFEFKRHRMSLFCSRQFAVANCIENELTVEQLGSLPFVLFSGKVKPFLDKLENAFGRKLHVVETHTSHAAFDMVMNGVGVGYFFDDYRGAQNNNEIVKLKLTNAELPDHVYDCVHARKPTGLVGLFVSELRKYFELD